MGSRAFVFSPQSPVPSPRPLSDDVIRQRRELVPKIPGVRQVRREAQDWRRCRRVDVHETRIGQRSLVSRAQRPVAVRPLVVADARERIPLAEQNAIALVALGVDDIEPGDAGELAGDRHEQYHGAHAGNRAAIGARREQHGGRDRQRRGREDDAGRAEAIEHWNQHQAACRRSHEIGRVYRVYLRRQPGDGERDDETAGEERQRGERVDREHQRQVVRRVIQADAEADEPEQGDDRAAGVDHRFGGEERVGGPALEARAGYVGEHAAGTDAEQRNRDREEREMVIHDDRKDAGERELGHQERSGHERDAGEMASGRRGHCARVYHPMCADAGRCPLFERRSSRHRRRGR